MKTINDYLWNRFQLDLLDVVLLAGNVFFWIVCPVGIAIDQFFRP